MSEPGKETGAAEQRRPSASEAELVADLKPRGALERMMIQQSAAVRSGDGDAIARGRWLARREW